MAQVTSIAYETRNGHNALPLKLPTPSLAELAEFCLNYLAQNPEQLAEFMGISGLDPQGLRGAVGTEGFARGLLDYVVSNESLLLAVCAQNNISPETVMRVWARLNPAG
jgi:hypothetical protein